jgi:hypothetical protein
MSKGWCQQRETVVERPWLQAGCCCPSVVEGVNRGSGNCWDPRRRAEAAHLGQVGRGRLCFGFRPADGQRSCVQRSSREALQAARGRRLIEKLREREPTRLARAT